jgi:hypothetical protein
MKRRSARPVVVEVKRTRTSTSSLSDAFGRRHSSKSLWQGVLLRAEAPTLARPEPKPQPPAVARTAEHDARPAPRVLPALVPLYVPSEPEPLVEAAELIRATRKPRSERKLRAPRATEQAVNAPATPKVAAEARGAAPVAVEPPLVSTPVPTLPLSGMERADQRERRPRHSELRRGERWKRRLPRACW